MVEVVQVFNGEERRVVGRARTASGVGRLVRSVLGAGEGWGVFVRGSQADLDAIGAVKRSYGLVFDLRNVGVFCEIKEAA